VSVGLALDDRKHECARVGVADVSICASAGAGAFCASQTLRTGNGPGRGTSATLVTPGTRANANLTTPCILGHLMLAWVQVAASPLLRGYDTLLSCLRAGPFKNAGKRSMLGDSRSRAVTIG